MSETNRTPGPWSHSCHAIRTNTIETGDKWWCCHLARTPEAEALFEYQARIGRIGPEAVARARAAIAKAEETTP